MGNEAFLQQESKICVCFKFDTIGDLGKTNFKKYPILFLCKSLRKKLKKSTEICIREIIKFNDETKTMLLHACKIGYCSFFTFIV
jgi:hypothetical protein